MLFPLRRSRLRENICGSDLITIRCRFHQIRHLVGHLNTVLAKRDGNLNEPIFKSSNDWGVAWGVGCRSFKLIDA